MQLSAHNTTNQRHACTQIIKLYDHKRATQLHAIQHTVRRHAVARGCTTFWDHLGLTFSNVGLTLMCKHIILDEKRTNKPPNNLLKKYLTRDLQRGLGFPSSCRSRSTRLPGFCHPHHRAWPSRFCWPNVLLCSATFAHPDTRIQQSRSIFGRCP